PGRTARCRCGHGPQRVRSGRPASLHRSNQNGWNWQADCHRSAREGHDGKCGNGSVASPGPLRSVLP
ncbi:lon, partial [Symbiodinium sp. CCMP2456]